MRLVKGEEVPVQVPGYDYMDFVPLRIVDELRDAYASRNRWRIACIIAWLGTVDLVVVYWMGGGR